MKNIVAVLSGIFGSIFGMLVILYYGAILALVLGWCANIYKLVFGSYEVTTEFVLRLVGIVLVPLGGVMGWV